MKRLSFLIAPALLTTVFAGCGSSDSTDPTKNPDGTPNLLKASVRLLVDTNRNGTIDENDLTEATDKTTWDAKHGAVFLANIDDDALACAKTGTDDALAKCNDAADNVVNGDDDLLDLAPMKVVAWPGAPDGASATVTIDDASHGHVRLFRKADGSFAEFDPDNDTLSVAEIRAGVEFAVEGTDVIRDSDVWNGTLDITLRISNGGVALGEDAVRMRMAPIVVSNHLDEPLQLYASNLQGDGMDSLSKTFQSDLTAAGKIKNLPPTIGLDHQDTWAQDYFEPSYMTMPAAQGVHTIRVNLRSANFARDSSGPASLRAAGRVVYTVLRGKDSGGVTAYDPKHDDQMDSLNSFGNLEVVPPYTFGDKSYPLGRVFRGKIPTFYPDPTFIKMIESQGMQDPIYVDTSWLLVGHVDELVSFLPADNARGWVVMAADPTMAKEMLSKIDGASKLHVGKIWYKDEGGTTAADTTAAEVLANTDVMSTSQKAAVKIKAALDILKKETGITDADIISVPFLFHTEYEGAIAFQPGMVNGLSMGKGHFIAPRPYGPVDSSSKDIFEAAFETAVAPFNTTIHWVDDWEMLHIQEGEVHCGSNTTRAIPKNLFWTSGK